MKLNYFFENTKEFKHAELFDGIKYPWEALEKSQEYIQREVVDKNLTINDAECKGNPYFEGNYIIGKGTVIHHGVTILGPVIIGENCNIAPGAYIRPYSIIGDNCEIGHCAEIKNSIIQNGAKVQSKTFCGDSVLGACARIGSGAITANRRFDQGNIKFKYGEDPVEKIELNTTFFGCVLGDYARVGANAVLQPGSIIGAYTLIFPGTNIRDFIPREKRAYHYSKILLADSPKVILE